jgi:hypothetical protein
MLASLVSDSSEDNVHSSSGWLAVSLEITATDHHDDAERRHRVIIPGVHHPYVNSNGSQILRFGMDAIAI